MATAEERLIHLEGAYEHLATKADLAEAKGELKTDIASLETRLIKWMIGLMVGSVAVASSIALIIQGFIQ